MNVIFRTDASVNRGTGHLMRCLTLADELGQRGADINFICRKEPGNLSHFVKKKGYKVYHLPIEVDLHQDGELTKKFIKKQKVRPDWLIIDHYGIDASWESSMRGLVNRIMAIDDMADRRHDCDILLDQNYNDDKNRYMNYVPGHCLQLIGPKYALLQSQFRKTREKLNRTNMSKIRKIMIFMGGADSTNETSKALRAIQILNCPDIATDVVIGAANPHRRMLETMALQTPNTICHHNISNMAEIMANADISIGGSGSATWERCCLGLPTITITLAENQRDVAESLTKIGVMENLGWHKGVMEKDVMIAVESLINDPDKRRRIASKSMEIVDGLGAKRLTDAIHKISTTHYNKTD